MQLKIFLVSLIAFSLTVQTFAQTRRATVAAVNQSLSNTPDNSQVLPIRRVILYSNGVAYIERRGMVTGNAEVNLQFKQSQVDDVLKSMVVLDLGQGRIGAVSYNSSAPPSARIAEIPFGIGTAEVGGMAEVLSQLQGAKVLINSSKGTVSGAILTVEKRTVQPDPGKPAIMTRFLVIASESGEISSHDLAEIKSVKLLEENTVKDVNEFANATASARRRDAKTITVTSEGNGQREMVVSYTIAAPIWKTTYRVVLDQEGKPFFQGWAIVDNVSDEDWKNVRLSLVSGTPISFIQPIQKPFYRYRPLVPIPNDLQLSPQVYDEENISGQGTESGQVSTVNSKRGTNLPLNGRQPQSLTQLQPGLLNNSSLDKSKNFMIEGESNNSTAVPNYSGSAKETTVSEALTGNNSGVSTAATGEEVGDLFEYKIEQPITVNRNRSALIPIVQTKMDGERVSIYNEAVRRDRPMGGMKLINTTPLTFEGGSLTILDKDAYAGEALMERLKPKEQRFIPFALDLGTLVSVKEIADKSAAQLIKAVDGAFQVHYFSEEKKTYSIQNQTDKPRTVFIEYPVRDDWELTPETPKPFVTTRRYHRFRVELKAFDKQEITVGVRQALMDSYALGNLTRNDLQLFVSRRYINEEAGQKLEKLIDLRTRISQIEQKLESFDNEEEKIGEDQARLRGNIEALSKTPEAKTLITRYIQKANDQETRLENIQKERETLTKQIEELNRELATQIRAFSL